MLYLPTPLDKISRGETVLDLIAATYAAFPDGLMIARQSRRVVSSRFKRYRGYSRFKPKNGCKTIISSYCHILIGCPGHPPDSFFRLA